MHWLWNVCWFRSRAFEIEDSGLSTVISQENIENESVSQAIDGCPTGAISISDSTTPNNN